MGIVMGTLVYSDVIIASYQTCISDIKGQSVGFFYDFWCNWRSLKPFLSRVILTHKDDHDESMDKLRSGNENYDLFCSLKVNGLTTRTKHQNDRLSIVDQQQ